MFINPMDKVGSISNFEFTGGSKNKNVDKQSFTDIFAKAINDVNETDAKVTQDIYNLTTGRSDDTHTLTIDSTKSQISLNLLIQLRNKTMDSYNELMRLNL